MKRSIIILALLWLVLALTGATPREQDDYSYIIELYDIGDYDDALAEIQYFADNYPHSEFVPYLEYIHANIALNKSDWLSACKLYEPLLKLDLHKEVKADIYLNYAISLYQLGDAKAAIKPLLELGLYTNHPYYVHNGSLWRGRCYQDLGLLLSAEHEYKKALVADNDDPGIEFEYYQLLLQLQYEEQAFALMQKHQNDPEYAKQYRLKWIHYLIYDQRYDELDEFLAQTQNSSESQDEDIQMLLIRKDFATGNFDNAGLRLKALSSSAHKSYFQALLLLNRQELVLADSLFRSLTHSKDPEIQFLSYLEHLKILYKKDAKLALNQLREYLKSDIPPGYKGQLYLLLANFAYQSANYPEAQKNWAEAKRFELSPELLDQAEIGTADTYFHMNQAQLAYENYNRYLNTFQNGRYRDRAFYRLGRIALEAKDLDAARQNLQVMLERYPASAYREDAQYLMGEAYYLGSHYSQALEYYLPIGKNHPSRRSISLRIAQCYYYLDRMTDAEAALNEIDPAIKDYEQIILKASLVFNRRDFVKALQLYKEAFGLAGSDIQKQEATSYQAYTLYFLKRFDEATQLFLSLSQLNPTVDSFLFQAAKSAYQGRNYNRALELYDRFVDDYPDSPHFLSVLSQIALCYYNLGNYNQSFADWLNILSRFRNSTSFVPAEVSLLKDVFGGLQLSLDSMNDLSPIAELLEIMDSFQSEYIRFEISYLVVRLYASYGQWDDVLSEAEEIRKKFPEQKRPELDLLLAQSLLMLNQQKEAEEIASQVFAETQSPQSLLALAKMAESSSDLEIAQQKYQELYQIQPNGSNWLLLLDISQKNGYKDYDAIWEMGINYAMDYPQARINRISFLISKGIYDQARTMANKILDSEGNQYIRGQADISLALIHYLKKDYKKAASAFKRARILYKDYPDILNQAHYYYILSLIYTEALKEAQLTLWEVQSQLTEDQVIIINDLLDKQR